MIEKMLERCWKDVGKMLEKCWKDLFKKMLERSYNYVDNVVKILYYLVVNRIAKFAKKNLEEE